MTLTIASHALWSDVTVPADQTHHAFHQWLLAHHLDPERVLVRGAVHGEQVVGVEVWSPLQDQPLPADIPTDGKDPLAWPVPGTVIALDGEASEDANEVLEALHQTINDSMLIPATVEPQPVELAPQAWRVLAHLAHWEDRQLFGDDDASFELSRLTGAGQRYPLDRDAYQRVRDSFLNGRHRSGMSMEQYHAWYGRSVQNVVQDERLAPAVEQRLQEHLAGLWGNHAVIDQQAMAQRLIKPHPLHAHLVEQAIERWHLNRSLATDPGAPVLPDARPRHRL